MPRLLTETALKTTLRLIKSNNFLLQRICPSNMNSTTGSKFVYKEEDLKYYVPSAPPPPSHFDYLPTATSIPVISNPPLSNTDNNCTVQFHPKHPVSWSSGLCNCFDDVNTCCLTCWCPCVTFGRIAEIVDKGSTSCGVSAALYTLILCVTGCSCLYSCFYRSKLRGQYFLKESPCTDCCIHCCCEECALCQEYRELKYHGFDMSTGWHGNIERQQRLDAIAPVVQGTMSR